MALLAADQCHAALRHIAKFLTAVGVHHKGFPALRQFHHDRFHFVFLCIGHDPVHRIIFPLIHKKILFVENDLLLLVLPEKFRKTAAQCLYDVVEGGNGRRGQISLHLGEKSLCQLTAAGQFFQRQTLLDPELFDLVADIHK